MRSADGIAEISMMYCVVGIGRALLHARPSPIDAGYNRVRVSREGPGLVKCARTII